MRGWSCCWDRLDRTGEELPLGVVTADVEEGGEVLWLETVEVDLGEWIIHATKIKLKKSKYNHMSILFFVDQVGAVVLLAELYHQVNIYHRPRKRTIPFKHCHFQCCYGI